MVRSFPKDLSRHFWNQDRGLTSIFIVLCVSDFLIIPFFDKDTAVILLLSRITWLFLLITGVLTLAKNRKQMLNLAIIPVLLITVNVLLLLYENTFLTYLEFIVKLATSGLLIWMVLVKVFEAGSVSVHRVIGSIVAYMLIGNLWADIFEFLYMNVPGSIQFPSVDVQTGVASSTFLYFSYTTLTTTGFGEILPVHAISRTVVIMEQLIGVLYPVVLIGRLVSLVAGNTNVKPDPENQ